MSHWLLLLLLALAGAGLIGLAWQMAKYAPWLLAWLRGCAVIACLLIASIVFAFAYDLARFDAVTGSERLATISVSASGPTTYLLEFTDTDGDNWYTTLSGDAWQLQIRGLLFTGPVRVLARSPAAKIHAVASRYYEFANRHQARSVVVAPSYLDSLFKTIGLDPWMLQQSVAGVLRALGIEYQEQGGAVVPLVDNAVYYAQWQRTHVAIEPGNEVARLSLMADEAALPGPGAAAN